MDVIQDHRDDRRHAEDESADDGDGAGQPDEDAERVQPVDDLRGSDQRRRRVGIRATRHDRDVVLIFH